MKHAHALACIVFTKAHNFFDTSMYVYPRARFTQAFNLLRTRAFDKIKNQWLICGRRTWIW